MMQTANANNTGGLAGPLSSIDEAAKGGQAMRISVGGKGAEGASQRSQTLEKPAASHTLLVSI